MLHVVESTKSVSELESTFPGIAKKHGFGVIGVHNLKQKMNEKGVPFEKDCLIFEVCNPQKAKKVLEENMSVSTALPCRVSIYQEAGKTKIASIKPTALIGMFNVPGLSGVAEEVEKTLFEIIKDMI